MEEKGEVHYILWICVMQNRKGRLITINQHAFLSSVLKRSDMEDCKSVVTSIEPGTKFKKFNNKRTLETTVWETLWRTSGNKVKGLSTKELKGLWGKVTLTECQVGVLKCDTRIRPGGLLCHSLDILYYTY